MSFEIGKLIIILLGSFAIGAVAVKTANGNYQKIMLLGLLGGLLFYSGIGASVPAVSWSYVGYYFGTFVGLAAGFTFGCIVFFSTARVVGKRLRGALGSMGSSLWRCIIVAYVLIATVPLLWPDLRIHQLLSPPSPDLKSLFSELFSTSEDPLVKVFGYIELLLTPFFYLALYRLRFRVKWVMLIIAYLLYVEYVDAAYIGRGEVMMHLGIVVLAVWFMRPNLRKRLVIVGSLVAPMLFYGFYVYGRIRIGGSVEASGIMEGIWAVLKTEWGFPKGVGMPIIESAQRVDLGAYVTWIATLPIPKILTGPIDGARINHEISEIVLGVSRGDEDWYVVLPGLVAEAVYIFGTLFSWVHGVVIGMAAAFFTRIAERVPQMGFLYFYVVLLFSYTLNRGGIAALLPPIMNEFLLFYLFLLYVVFRSTTTRSSIERRFA